MGFRIILVLAIFGLATLSFVSADLYAQDKNVDYAAVVGTWSLETEGWNGGTRTFEWVLSMREDTLVATVPMRSWGGGDGGTQDINDVQFDGENLHFSLEREWEDETFTIDYAAKITDEKITGTFGVGDQFSRDFTGKLVSAKEDKVPSGPHYAKQVEVLGIYIYATNTVSDEKLLHAAGVLAQYIDNDEDGVADNPKIMRALIEAKGAITMRKTNQELTTGPRPRGQGLYDEETRPNARAEGTFDGAWEEILHMLTDHGWGGAYPEVFGRVPGTEQANAMDLARGGRFIEIPEEYPDNAWYTYADESCNYDCQNSEYIYWSVTTFMGIQDYPGRSEEIGQEWRPTTREQLKERDPAIFAILSNPEYKVPSVIPDGNYDGKTLKVETYTPE